MTDIFASEKSINRIWDKVWQDSADNNAKEDSLLLLVYHALEKEITAVSEKAILEAGCGTGRISVKLGELGAGITCVDISANALALAKSNSASFPGKINFVRNSIKSLSFRSSSYDIVWNAGVLEHFDIPEQKQIVAEMLRITKADGRVIILVPYAKAVLYRLGKWLREKLKIWKLGREIPLESVRHLLPKDGDLVKEYFIGVSEQTFLLPKGLKKLTQLAIDILIHSGLGNFLAKMIGGYLLVAVIQKNMAPNNGNSHENML
jgi:SAM-dependent methyltransferase